MGEAEGAGVGSGVAVAAVRECCGRPSGPNGVAIGTTGNVAFGASVLSFSGSGVTIPIAPFDRAVTVGGFPTFQMKAGSLEKPEQFVVVDGFDQKVHSACLHCPYAARDIAATGQKHDGTGWPPAARQCLL